MNSVTKVERAKNTFPRCQCARLSGITHFQKVAFFFKLYSECKYPVLSRNSLNLLEKASALSPAVPGFPCHDLEN